MDKNLTKTILVALLALTLNSYADMPIIYLVDTHGEYGFNGIYCFYNHPAPTGLSSYNLTLNKNNTAINESGNRPCDIISEGDCGYASMTLYTTIRECGINYSCQINEDYGATTYTENISLYVNASSCTTSTTTTTNAFPYYLPDENYGTLPGLNGSGGTLPSGGVSNTTGLGDQILGFKTNKLLQWFAIFLALGLLVIRPFALGVGLSAFSVMFFTLIIPWNVYTTSVCLIIIFIAMIEVLKVAYKTEAS